MKINDDYLKRVVLDTHAVSWVDSPIPGVQRRMLERDGGEVARATSIVRYAPMSSFPSHSHEKGEEFLVLDGIFSDERGDYPAGTFVRNPPGSSHSPFTGDGCTIFVKLRQWSDPFDRQRVVVDTREGPWFPATEGGEVIPLHRCTRTGELTMIHRLGEGETYRSTAVGGEEILILQGTLEDAQGVYPKGTWLRRHGDFCNRVRVAKDECLFYRKSGHVAAVYSDKA